MRKFGVLLSTVIAAGLWLALSTDASAAAPGRPIIQNNTLKTSGGDLIRAGVAYYGKSYPKPTGEVEDPKYWRRASAAGLNAIRVTNWDEMAYGETGLETWSIADNLTHLDTIVQNAKDNGLYVILTPGDDPGTFSKPYLTSFWSVAADRYKNDTNVIYEMTNEPVSWSPNDYTNAKMDNLADIYQIMRAAAPNTPILSLAFSHANEDMTGKVTYFANKAGIVWANQVDVISYHTYGTSNITKINALKAQHPVMNTEWNYPQFNDGAVSLEGKKYQGQAHEEAGISSMNFRAGRSDGRFTEYYDYVNDAKYKGYYWIPGVVTSDPLNDWSNVYAFSANTQFAAGNPQYFNGDASRVTRTDTNPGYIIYKNPGIGKFKAHIYSNDSFAGIKFYVSRNGADWEKIASKKTTPVGTSGGWEGAYFSSDQPIPSGTEYLKIELSSTTAFHITQIADVELTSWSDGGLSVIDNLNAWSVSDSHSANMQFNTANPSTFGGDDSRAARSDTNPGYVVYKLDNLGGFYAHIYYRNTLDGVNFYTSADGTNWTPATTLSYDPEATTNGWHSIYIENDSALPSGTKYVKVEMTTTIAANNTQLADMRVYVKY